MNRKHERSTISHQVIHQSVLDHERALPPLIPVAAAQKWLSLLDWDSDYLPRVRFYHDDSPTKSCLDFSFIPQEAIAFWRCTIAG